MATHMLEVIGSTSRVLHQVVGDGVQAARRRGRARLVSYSLRSRRIDPLTFYMKAQYLGRERFYWERVVDQVGLVGVGAAWVVRLHGVKRFDEAARAWRRLTNEAIVAADEASSIAAGPTLVGGFAFDPEDGSGPIWDGFPSGRFVVPRLMLSRQGEATWLTINVLVNGDDDPDVLVEGVSRQIEQITTFANDVVNVRPNPSVMIERAHASANDWQALVSRTAAAARRGDVEKVVLARAESIISEHALQSAPVLSQLRAEYPGCTVFAVARRHACFLGASPERLAQLRDGEVKVSCLAGTTSRGTSVAEDARLGQELLDSPKNRAEHAVVVRILRESVGDLCCDVDVPEQPILLKVRNVQHLYTPLSGRLRPEFTLLDVVQRLHPTPAVGGFPREVALDLIRKTEGLARGWYAGPIGWIDFRGNGDFAVAIRSALLRGVEAVMFSGCGIVADSNPEAEYEESCLKFQPMRSALRMS